MTHADNWSLVYEGYAPEHEPLREALCTLGNGYIATRGASPDTPADGLHYPGTYLAGGYNRLVTPIAGRDLENEDLVNFPNWLALTFRVDSECWFQLDDVELLEYTQTLALDEGLLKREFRFRDHEDRITRWREHRLVSMAEPHEAAVRVELRAENWSGTVTIRSAIDGSVTNDGVARYRDLNSRHLEILRAEAVADDTMLLHSHTNQSRLELAQAARTRVFRGDEDITNQCQRSNVEDAKIVAQELTCTLDADQPITVDKSIAQYSSRDPAISEVTLAAREHIARIPGVGALIDKQRQTWRHLWDEFDVDIACRTESTLLKLRVHIFHVLQTISPHTIEYDIGAPARGWHGEAYRGHIFWDELFVFPFLNMRLPVITRALLRYRYRRLNKAREAARDAGYAGAMYPWQSGSDGREETQRMHLNPRSNRWITDNSFRQRHINSAIAYNIWQYYEVTDDHEFMYFYGTEMLLEIARFWNTLATWNEQRQRYEIRGVMGPDEYHTAYPGFDAESNGGMNNNSYTNVMASWCLMRAQDALALLPREHCDALCEALDLTEDEITRWDYVSRNLFIPFHDGGIISQFEGYETLEEFDWDHYRQKYGDISRLDRILEGEDDTPNNYKVSKQADVLMLFYLFSPDELGLLFERLGYSLHEYTIARNVEYYLARTSDGSTLSYVSHAWVLIRNRWPRAWNFFQAALDSDIQDVQGGTTSEGIHLGAMAGSLDIVHRCVLGLEARENVLHFDPVLPEELEGITVLLRYRRHKLKVRVDHRQLTISSLPATTGAIAIAYRGQMRHLVPGTQYSFILVEPPTTTGDGSHSPDRPSL